MSATAAKEFPPLLPTEGGPGDALLRRLKMRALPIQAGDVVVMAIPGVIPALPLAAMVMPVSEIVKDLMNLLV